jgi:hypothetical protein
MAERLSLDDANLGNAFVDTRGLSINERLAVAFRLGDEACRSYAEQYGISQEEAAVRLKAKRQVGRIPLFADAPQEP